MPGLHHIPFRAPAATTTSPFTESLRDAAMRHAARLVDAFARTKQRRLLMRFDGRILSDLGLSRADAFREWSKSPWRD